MNICILHKNFYKKNSGSKSETSSMVWQWYHQFDIALKFHIGKLFSLDAHYLSRHFQPEFKISTFFVVAYLQKRSFEVRASRPSRADRSIHIMIINELQKNLKNQTCCLLVPVRWICSKTVGSSWIHGSFFVTGVLTLRCLTLNYWEN